MAIENKIVTVALTCMLLISIFAVVARNLVANAQGENAQLTGNIFDNGKDTDANGKYDYLEVAVEINVSTSGDYRITANGLKNQYGYLLYLLVESQGYLTEGLQNLKLDFYGPAIYGAMFDPARISEIDLYVWEYDYYSPIGHIVDVPLSHSYSFTDFDCPARLTGAVYDDGVDTDSDGLFDYLKVGVEVNVTEIGAYVLSVEGIRGMQGSSLNTLYRYQSLDVAPVLGVQFVNFTFQGPMIAQNHLNPTNITGVRLSEKNYCGLNYTSWVDLPTKYNSTQFDPPSTEMDFEFTVYPDATIGFGANVTQTHMLPDGYFPKFNATMGFSTSGAISTGFANGTLLLDERMFSFLLSPIDEWPTNSTTATFLANYYNGMLNAQLNASVLMPPAGLELCPFNSTSGNFMFRADYADGVVAVDLSGVAQLCPQFASMFPFNVSDLRLVADYFDKKFSGNITLHMLGGFPLGDVTVDFVGNESEVTFSGNVNVTYSNLFGDPIDEGNVTHYIEYLYNMTGQGDASVYNMTGGAVEFTQLDLNRTYESYGEMINYTATFAGNFISAISKTIVNIADLPSEDEPTICAALDTAFSSVQNGTLQLNFYNTSKIIDFELTLYSDVKKLWTDAVQLIPPTLPEEARAQVEAILKMANATAHALQNAELTAIYSGEQQRLNVTATLEANITKLKANVLPLIPDALSSEMPPGFGELFEPYSNTTYCELKTLTVSANLTKGLLKFRADWMCEGNFEAQINHEKRFFIDLSDMMSYGEFGGSLRLLNVTEIDVGNAMISVEQGEDWMEMSLKNVILHPPRDDVDPIRFRLYNWLNVTSSDPDAPPQEFEKLKITVACGFNGTHTVLLHDPGILPQSDFTGLDYKTMTWENVTMSGIKDLNFNVAYQGVIPYAGRTFYVPVFTNSTVSNFGFSSSGRSINFNVTGTAGMGFCNITIPRTLLNASLSEWSVRVDGHEMTAGEFNITGNSGFVFIYVAYGHSTHLIEVGGTWAIAEYPLNMLPLALAIGTFIAAVIAIRQRKKLGTLKTKYQNTLRTLVARLRLP